MPRAGVPMLPVVKGKPHTRLQILLYAGAGAAGRVARAAGHRRRAVSGGAAGIGLWFLWEAVAVYRERDARQASPPRIGCSAFRCFT